MEQVTDTIGNPMTLLIERIFWLGLGGFFSLALITSFFRGSKKSNQLKQFPGRELEKLAKKAVQQNDDFN
tara:strand:+ start:497 stop:706 length:210 start_codon:yes stop_codon:yes gene_type:complete